MPIAHCFVAPGILDTAVMTVDGIVGRWAEASGIGPETMTLNVVERAAQGGVSYDVMVWLQLPDLWSADEVVSLQEGIATAWTEAVARSVDLVDAARSVHVVTSVVASGHVVEDGATVVW